MAEFIVFLILLGLGWGVGTARERAHFRDLGERQQRLAHMLVTNVKTFPPRVDVSRPPTLVVGQTVIASDFLKSFVAGLRRILGGELRSYQTLLTRAQREATLRMMEEAHAKGYNAVCNMRLTTADIGGMAGGRGAAMAEAMATGTAYLTPDGPPREEATT